MKRILNSCVLISIIVFSVACGSSNNQTIGKNVDPDVTELGNVKTFGWIGEIDKIPEQRIFLSETGIYVYNNESARKRIKEAVEHELNARGYNLQTAGQRPGALVSFYVLEQAGTLRRTNGYVTIEGKPVISADDVEQVPVEPGTLIVNLVHNETNQMVWQGFASGIIKPNDLNDEAKIRQAVSSIFSQFTYDAKN